MSRFSPVDLSAYPVSDILETLSFESYLARDRADLQARWNARRALSPGLPAFDTLFLESDPSSVILETGAAREVLLRQRINDAMRSLTLAGAGGAALDHIGITYYRTPRRFQEDDETYRQRLALAPESWSTAGPVGAYIFHALSSSPDVKDVAVYSEDEGVTKAPTVRVVILPQAGTATHELLATVKAQLSRTELRPMGDEVLTEAAEYLPFNVTIDLKIRAGAPSDTIAAAAKTRVENYCRGLLRWAGDGVTGPVWLIGRTFTTESLAGVAMAGDPNVLSADVLGGDINAPHPGYTEAALFAVGTDAFVPLAEAVTAHLFRAPILGTVTINAASVVTGWVG